MSGPHGGEQAQFHAEDRRRINLAYRRSCPRCHAEPGDMCIDAEGHVRYQLHPERVKLITDEADPR